jgi:hypothetical protein
MKLVGGILDGKHTEPERGIRTVVFPCWSSITAASFLIYYDLDGDQLIWRDWKRAKSSPPPIPTIPTIEPIPAGKEQKGGD